PLIAAPVTANVPVTVTIQDSLGRTAAANLTVKPALLLPGSITITGNPNCAGSNATLCSGQDGTASVQLTSAGGTPVAGRQVRFDVVLGDFTLLASSFSVPAQSVSVTTDQNGLAAVT